MVSGIVLPSTLSNVPLMVVCAAAIETKIEPDNSSKANILGAVIFIFIDTNIFAHKLIDFNIFSQQ